ncbi:MAG: hypothetical protein K2K46_02515 [Lachnospiraceae bacterium]|nr:hypothetical protein [Lachnospiraceae bacterium]
MKRFYLFMLAPMLIFSCEACSATQKSPIGTSTIGNSPIEASLEASSDNTESAAENIDNAETTPENIDTEENNKTAQLAYDLIEDAESLCESGMGIISSAWHFGIWDAPECERSTVIEKLSAQIGFEVSFIEENGNYDADTLINGDGNFGGWEFCLMTAENCLSAAGTYTSVNDALNTARDLIREIPEDYANYQNLKEYYTKVAAYAAYFENVTGSYNDLTESINKYEKDIQEAKETLLFDFG